MSGARSRAFVCTPAFTSAPSITGQAKSGQTLTATTGTIARGSVQSRQWKRDGVAIAGATAGTYVCQAADVGHVITHAVTAVNSLNAANTTVGTSAPTATVIA